jgi:hypothetical protein
MESITELNYMLHGLGDVVRDSETDPVRAISKEQARHFATLIHSDTQPLAASHAAFGPRYADVLIALQLRGVIPAHKQVWDAPKDARNSQVTFSRTFINPINPDTIPCPAIALGTSKHWNVTPFKIINPRTCGKQYNDKNVAGVSCPQPRSFGGPMDDSPYSIAIRAHEYSHLATFRAWPELGQVEIALDPMGVINMSTFQSGLDNIANPYGLAHGVEVIHDLVETQDSGGFGSRATALLQNLSYKEHTSTRDLPADTVAFIRDCSARLRAIGANLDNTHFESWDVVEILIRFNHWIAPRDAEYRREHPEVYREAA